MQTGLATKYPIDRKEADLIASKHIIEHIGSIPSPGKIDDIDDHYVVDIVVKYPRPIYDASEKVLKKFRYVDFGKVGELVIEKETGKIINPPRFYDVKSVIDDRLDNFTLTIEQVLVKVGASNFARLPWASHRHTPIYDVISFLVFEDRFEIRTLNEFDTQTKGKYQSIIELLWKLKLLEKEREFLFPGRVLVGLEEEYKDSPPYILIEKAIAYVFSEGYEDIKSIRDALSTPLFLCEMIYEPSIEGGECVTLEPTQIAQEFISRYRWSRMKVNRYLFQLNEIDMIEHKKINGTYGWRCNEQKFEEIMKEPLMEPLLESLL